MTGGVLCGGGAGPLPLDRHAAASDAAAPAAAALPGRLTAPACPRLAVTVAGAGAALAASVLLFRDRCRRSPRKRHAVQRPSRGGNTQTLVEPAVAAQSVRAVDEDVVVVFDSNSQTANGVVATVERDCAGAPKPVAFRTIPASNFGSVAAVCTERGVLSQELDRMRQQDTVVAILPSGAVLADLEKDVGPLLRELRYRTCLQAPTEAERANLERTFFQPLRVLRERWWWNPMAMSVLAKQLAEEDFVVIDGFLPEDLARRLRADNERLYVSSEMQGGATTGGQQRVGLPHRGDVLKWIGYDGAVDQSTSQSVGEYASCIEDALDAMRQISAREAPDVAQALGGVKWRSEAMLTCYPGESRARYFRHTDNSSGNGRLLTAIVYLNEGWEPGHGGELRLFHKGQENLKIKAEIQPLWNRLLLFWSDDRCPHEVLSACQDRYACTVWYYDQQNSTIPMFELGSSATQPGPAPAPPQVPQPPVASAPPPAPSPPPQASPPAPAHAVQGTGVGDAEEKAPKFFFDGRHVASADLAASLDVQSFDLRDAGATHGALLDAAGPAWAAKLDKGVDILCAEAGSAFLVKPDGGVLRSALKEGWMLDYELKYWRDVRAATPETKRRIDKKLFEPLEAVRLHCLGSAGLQPNQPWWGLQEAIDVWGPALAEESFIVLDDFMPAPAASALAAAVRQHRDSMQRGQTDSALSAEGRGDHIAWVEPGGVPELAPLVDHLNALVGGMMDLQQPEVQARLSQVTALSDCMLAVYPGHTSDNARYIRHVDNEDGQNGRLLTCVYYLNDDWDVDEHGGQLRVFEPNQQRVKADIAPKFNRVVAFFSDSSVPHEVLRAKRERHAVTIWYINQETHLAYHSQASVAAASAAVDAVLADDPQ